MSDGMTDMQRAVDENRAFVSYLNLILRWLKKPTDKDLKKLATQGLSTSRTLFGFDDEDEDAHILANIQSRMSLLRDGDKQVWARFLTGISRDANDLFMDFKKLSPFSDEVFVVVDYGLEFVTLRGEIEPFLEDLIKGKGWKTYDCNTYVALIPWSTTPIEVIKID